MTNGILLKCKRNVKKKFILLAAAWPRIQLPGLGQTNVPAGGEIPSRGKQG